MSKENSSVWSCPSPATTDQITLAHGGGGKLMHDLLESLIIPAFNNEQLNARHDGAVLNVQGVRLALATDSYVVRPLFFPGGDIGTLAVNGTVNDLAMCGARPICLSAGLIIEEGLSVDTLARVIESMRRAAQSASVHIVTGDTKVVDKGKGDGLYINTAGIGLVEHGTDVSAASVRPGDVVLLSGDIGRHGLAVMAQRDGIDFESTFTSDCAPVSESVLDLLESGIAVHCLRDLTRGGLATALVEIAETAQLRIAVRESKIDVRPEVRGACEILGFDPLYLPNEGRFVAFVPQAEADEALSVLRRHEVSRNAVAIGTVSDSPHGTVVSRTTIGTERLLDMLSGEQLPRIC